MKLILTISMVIIFAVGFWGGTLYQKSQQSTVRGSRFGNEQQRVGFPSGQGPVSGSIVSRDTNTITIKLSDGSTKIVVYSQNTSVRKTSSADIADLKDGEDIVVMGTDNSDGTITAQTISIGMQGMRGAIQNPTAQ